jgi:hypothetical protein
MVFGVPQIAKLRNLILDVTWGFLIIIGFKVSKNCHIIGLPWFAKSDIRWVTDSESQIIPIQIRLKAQDGARYHH